MFTGILSAITFFKFTPILDKLKDILIQKQWKKLNKTYYSKKRFSFYKLLVFIDKILVFSPLKKGDTFL